MSGFSHFLFYLFQTSQWLLYCKGKDVLQLTSHVIRNARRHRSLLFARFVAIAWKRLVSSDALQYVTKSYCDQGEIIELTYGSYEYLDGYGYPIYNTLHGHWRSVTY